VSLIFKKISPKTFGLHCRWKSEMLDQVSKMDVVTLPSQILWLLSESPNLWAAYHYHAEARFLLDSCEDRLVGNACWLLSASWGRLRSFLPSWHHIDKNYFFRWLWSWPCLLMKTFWISSSGELENGAIPWFAFCLQSKMMDLGFIFCNNLG